MTGKTIGIAFCLLAIAGRSAAQELGITLNGGFQGTMYSLPGGKVQQLPAGSFGISYSFRLGSHWDLVTGLTGGMYRTKATLGDSAIFTSYQVDDAGSAFRYDVKAAGYQETQQFFAADIPLLVQYHSSGIHTRWWLRAGGRALFPLTASIRQSATQLMLSGYYPDYNLEVSNLPEHGFGTVKGWKASEMAPLKPAAVASVATGLSFRLSRGSWLYTGLYLDYGLTPLRAGKDSLPFASYSPAGISGTKVNSVLKMPGTGQMDLLSYGLQIGISFGSTKMKNAPRPVGSQLPATGEPQVTTAAALTDAELDIIQKPVLFGSLDETAVSEIMKTHLNDVAVILLKHPEVRISITGHICNSETGTEDVTIGQARAAAVEQYLRTKGVRRKRMDVGYASESDPVVPNNPGANYQKRRTVIAVE